MTVENCIKLLEAYEKQMENPVNEVGVPLRGDQRKHVISQSKHNYEMMKERILNNPKFEGHSIREKLAPKPKTTKKEKA